MPISANHNCNHIGFLMMLLLETFLVTSFTRMLALMRAEEGFFKEVLFLTKGGMHALSPDPYWPCSSSVHQGDTFMLHGDGTGTTEVRPGKGKFPNHKSVLDALNVSWLHVAMKMCYWSRTEHSYCACSRCIESKKRLIGEGHTSTGRLLHVLPAGTQDSPGRMCMHNASVS
jgi:hypothetical protein